MAPVVLLASNSPRRRKLLGLAGWDYETRPADIDESLLPDEAPGDYVLRLAEGKARAAGLLAQPGQIVLAADTTVADGNTIMGKPADAAEARAMLASLRGRDHWVYTAAAVLDPSSGRLELDLCGTRVWMRDYSGAEIEAYIESGDPFDKAGAYAIQNASFHPVDRIEGCYPNVVGLPVCRAAALLRSFNLSPAQDKDITWNCHGGANSACPVYRLLMGLEQSTGSHSQGKEK
jgi:septum formation protein